LSRLSNFGCIFGTIEVKQGGNSGHKEQLTLNQ
jgi:hypothetical protein